MPPAFCALPALLNSQGITHSRQQGKENGEENNNNQREADNRPDLAPDLHSLTMMFNQPLGKGDSLTSCRTGCTIALVRTVVIL